MFGMRAKTDNIRFGRGKRQHRIERAPEDPIEEAARPSNAPPPAWMADKNLLPKSPPRKRRMEER